MAFPCQLHDFVVYKGKHPRARPKAFGPDSWDARSHPSLSAAALHLNRKTWAQEGKRPRGRPKAFTPDSWEEANAGAWGGGDPDWGGNTAGPSQPVSNVSAVPEQQPRVCMRLHQLCCQLEQDWLAFRLAALLLGT